MARFWSNIWLLFVALAVAVCTTANAQQVLVATTAESAAGVQSQTSVQQINLNQLPAHPVAVPLPGAAPVSPLLVSSTSPVAACITATANRVYASIIELSGRIRSTVPFAADYYPADACLALGSSGEILVVANRSTRESPVWPGLVQGFRLDEADEQKAFELHIQAACVAAAPIAPGDRVAILCRGPLECAASVTIVDTAGGEVSGSLDNLVAENELISAAPCGIAASQDGATLFVLVSGYALNQRSGEASSWLYCLDPQTLEQRGQPLEIEGVAAPADRPLQPASEDLCWVATRPRGTDFAYATLVRAGSTGLEKLTQVPYTGVTRAFHLAVQPNAARAAIAADDRVELRDEHGALVAKWSFNTPVRALRWSMEDILAADAGRVHLLRPGAAGPVRTAQLQSGQITDIVPALHLPDHPAPTPALHLPPWIGFRGEAAGQEVKALVIEPDPATPHWQVQYDRGQLPWLMIHPMTGSGRGVVYMGMDPARHNPGDGDGGVLMVKTAATRVELPAAPGQEVQLEVLPEARSELRRILWIWDDENAGTFRSTGDQRGLDALANALAGPPHFFTHKEVAGAVDHSLRPYTVVVLSASAAARGLISRQALLDYAVQGGAILFLGSYLSQDGSRDLAQWLSPVGIGLNTQTLVSGKFETSSSHFLARHWPAVALQNGCALYADQQEHVVVPGPTVQNQHSAVLVARSYGRGRIAAMAAATPLQAESLQAQQAKLFASDLFEWLAGVNEYLENQDMDSDGLPDALEDMNGNGVVDSGETDFLRADSDMDGIPDGLEDLNLNGKWDEGETDALNPDSDDDGVRDGADEAPLALADVPRLRAVSPEQGPSEGGTAVAVYGRNFPADASVWFGDRPSPSVRIVDSTELLAETPACLDPDGGVVDVRVRSASAQAESALDHAFTYLRRPPLRLVLKTLRHIVKTESVYRGEIVAVLEKPADTDVSSVTLVLAPCPAAGLTWQQPVQQDKRKPVVRPLRSGELLVAVLHQEKAGNPIPLVTIPWQAEVLPQVQVKHCLAYAPNGQLLKIEAPWLDLAAAWNAQKSP